MKSYTSLNCLSSSKSVCIIGHINADPDALSSMVVLKEILQDVFKINKVDLFSEAQYINGVLLDILEDHTIYTNLTTSELDYYDTCIFLDSPNLDRLGCFKNLFYKSKLTINIDHHATNMQQAQINIVENVSSCCEIIHRIAKHFNYNLSNNQKGKLYAGIITDTNNFTVGNFTDETFAVCSDLSNGIDKIAIYQAFLSNNSLKSMQLLALAINNISSFDENQIIITHITHEEANKLKASHDDLCKIVNQVATINSSKMVCFIEPQDEKYYVSMRAKEGYNVASIAKSHGGGGHIGAAAFLSCNTLQETKDIILNEFRKQVNQVFTKGKKIFQ